MLVSALLQNAQSVIDLFWVGRLGPAALAAVAMGGAVMMMVFPAIMGLSAGTIALVARSVGAGRPWEAGRVAGQSLLLALLVGAVTAGIGAVFSRSVLVLLDAAPEVADEGGHYLRILLAGSFTMNLLFVGNAALQGAGDTVRPMAFMATAAVLNIGLDPLLIFGIGPFPELGVRGAAWATVLAQAVAAIGLVAHLHRRRARVRLRARLWRPDARQLGRIVRIGLPGSGQMLARSLVSLVLMRLVAGFGTAAVAAYGTAWRCFMVFLMPAFVLGAASATIVGQCLGAGRPRRARRAAWLATGYDAAFIAVAALGVVVYAPAVIGVFNDDPEVIRIGVRLLRIVAPSYLLAAPAIILGRSLQGAGDTFWPMVATVISLWGVQLPLAVFASRGPDGRLDGIWWAMVLAIAVHAVLVTAWFETGRWQRREV